MSVSGSTGVVGIIGHPVTHTLSPAMQNAAFQALKLNYIYIPFDVRPESVAAAIGGLKVLGIRGVNVTIPHKEAVLPYMDSLTPEAKTLGAVNTVVFDGETVTGANTDGPGFIRAMRESLRINPRGRRFVVIGAGGAGRGVAIQLALEGASRVILLNRTPRRASELACEVKQLVPACHVPAMDLSPPALAYGLGAADIVINATPLGMGDRRLPFPAKFLERRHIVCDLVYRPAVTPLLAMARKKGCRTMNGMGMLLHQGALAFELWTGRKAPLIVMRRALEKALRPG